MKKYIIIIICIGIIPLLNGGDKNPLGSTKYVHAAGADIVAPDGKPLFLRGIGLGNWLVQEGYMFKFGPANSPRLVKSMISELIGPANARSFWKRYYENYVTREDIFFIKNSGLNHIRVPFNYRLFTPEEHPEVWLDLGFEIFDRLVSWCKEAQLYIIFDMHCAPGGQTGDNIDDSWGWPWLYESEECQDRTALVWQKIAERYHDEPIVIGYDLMNEPIPHWDEFQKYNSRLEPLYKKMIKAIREVDQNHIVFIGGRRWNTRFDIFGPPFDNNAVYTFHKYWSKVDQNSIQEFIDFREKYQVPIWMGESGENTTAWIDSFSTLLEKNKIGYCYWPYKKLQSERGMVSIVKPMYYEEIEAYTKKLGKTFQEIRQTRPSLNHVQQALDAYLENIRLEKCVINNVFIDAMHPITKPSE